VTLAAQAAEQTVAQWLDPVIDAALSGEAISVNAVVNHARAAAESANEFCRLVEAACLFAQWRGQMPKRGLARFPEPGRLA
jgi:hypothetical protein